MDEISAAFANAYQSKRLVYRDIENNDADKGLMHKFGPTDHISWGLVNSRLFRDINKKASLDWLGQFLESGLLLKVLICLPDSTKDVESSKLGPGSRAAKIRENATPIGSLTLSKFREGSLQASATTVGICIGEEYQNQGFGAEAISWAVDWAFKFANVHRVEIVAASYNERAVHLYQKLGFRLEGRKREVIYMNRKYYDAVEFGMLENDWKELSGSD
ncbi:acyl-CoA N-acyltransferase [Diplogelasinospora grovesii]|uniref:Acyl-CoA N-acyltransferase n=1 Tax=Diplogelasinospora grovesii TaxID=303347 RepID=A0AAN6S1Q9_9PEZI|nr:acyl-CoA N-acyltransferase [Diplogelasinospora grovesii]